MTSHFGNPLRCCLAVGLCFTCPASLAWAQQASIGAIAPKGPAIIRPYLAPEVPPVRVANSPRLSQLVRAGTLYLTVQDAIALALENNIDIEIARYNPLIAAWNLKRAEAGGTLPGVPSNASQAGSVAAGQGVAGSQAAAGVGILGTGGNRGQTTNASIQQIGPVTQTLDPIIQEASTFSHTSTPQPNAIQSVVQVLITDTRTHAASYQQGTLSGGSVTVSYNDHYLNENAPTDVLNPSTAPNLSISAQHNLLRGFGISVNARTITVAKSNLALSDLSFKTQVIGIVTQVLNVYYGLASAYEDVKAKKTTADVAQTFFANVKRQVELGSLAPSETIVAENQAITSRRALIDAETTLQQQELQLKNLISRDGTADPVLRTARIVPTDTFVIPEQDDLPPLDEMVKQALSNRSDLAVEQQNLKNTEISSLGTKNGVLPTLGVFAAESQAGLAGMPRTVITPASVETANPYFIGGLGTALGQVFRRNFPTERAGAFYVAELRNRQAQADYAIDQLQFRQTQLTVRKDLNQIQVDVLNYVIALRQARARYDAAVHNLQLQQQLFAAEQKKFNLGASIPYNVIQQQRDLITAQSTQAAGLAAYSTARIALERTLGTLLSGYHVTLR